MPEPPVLNDTHTLAFDIAKAWLQQTHEQRGETTGDVLMLAAAWVLADIICQAQREFPERPLLELLGAVVNAIVVCQSILWATTQGDDTEPADAGARVH